MYRASGHPEWHLSHPTVMRQVTQQVMQSISHVQYQTYIPSTYLEAPLTIILHCVIDLFMPILDILVWSAGILSYLVTWMSLL